MLCFLVASVLRFALFPYHRRIILCGMLKATETIDNRIINAQAAFTCLNLTVKTPEQYV